MRRKFFGEYVDRKKREAVRQLGLVKKLLEQQGLKAESFLEGSDDPYVFCYDPAKNSGFDGIRIYKIGEEIAFRVQKENRTHPYGSAYPLPIEEMFHDFIGDKKVDQLKAGKKVIESVVKEIRSFFDKSAEAEKKDRDRNVETDKEGAGNMLLRGNFTDYSTMIKGG